MRELHCCLFCTPLIWPVWLSLNVDVGKHCTQIYPFSGWLTTNQKVTANRSNFRPCCLKIHDTVTQKGLNLTASEMSKEKTGNSRSFFLWWMQSWAFHRSADSCKQQLRQYEITVHFEKVKPMQRDCNSIAGCKPLTPFISRPSWSDQLDSLFLFAVVVLVTSYIIFSKLHQ